jgi:uncharacterized protein (DUF302 family)/uncharacterized membrane protein YidH (DUF202 family)
MPDESTATPRDFLAVERTFLAWIRTGLALMGLGFVLARFGIFLREFNLNQPNQPSQSFGLSLWFGTALIFLGVFVCLLSLVRYRRLLQKVQQPEALLARPSALAITVALVLAILGVAMAIYLISVRPIGPHDASKSREISMAPIPENGILRTASNYSVEETVARLKSILEAKGVKFFTIVDHSGEAASAGLKMPNTKLLIFGNPKAGTPLMLASPSAALDLPLKILIAEDSGGKVWISYNAPAYLLARHRLPPNLLPNIAVIETLAAKAAE